MLGSFGLRYTVIYYLFLSNKPNSTHAISCWPFKLHDEDPYHQVLSSLETCLLDSETGSENFVQITWIRLSATLHQNVM